MEYETHSRWINYGLSALQALIFADVRLMNPCFTGQQKATASRIKGGQMRVIIAGWKAI